MMRRLAEPAEGPSVHVLPGLEAMSWLAAHAFTDLSKKLVEENGAFSAAISGGATPRRLYELLGSEQYSGEIPWEKVHIFWTDERCVPPGSPDSNYGSARGLMLSRVPIPDGNVHRIKGEEKPEEAALMYEDEIRRFFGRSAMPVFDLVILGVGEDGHTASLFPGSDALGEMERLAVPVYAERLKSRRVTLTLPAINNADRVLFMVAGEAKAEAVHRVIDGVYGDPHYPASLVHPVHGKLFWFIDEPAASKLKGARPQP